VFKGAVNNLNVPCFHPAMGPGPHDKDTVLAATRAGIINVRYTKQPCRHFLMGEK